MSGLQTSNRVLKELRTPSELSKSSLKFEIKVLNWNNQVRNFFIPDPVVTFSLVALVVSST